MSSKRCNTNNWLVIIYIKYNVGNLYYTVKYKEVFLWITIEIGHAEGIDIMDIVNQQTIQIVELIVDPIVGQIAEQIVTQIVDNKN